MTMPARYSDAEIEEASEAFTRWALNDVDQPYALLIDGRQTSWLAPRHLALWAKVEAKTRPVEKHFNVGQAFVINSSVVWKLVSAVQWISPPTYPARFFASLEPAEEWLRTFFDQERTATEDDGFAVFDESRPSRVF
ncbi:MAG: hypothetical protein AAFV36_01040 [Myxococcota bacterium]